MVFDIALVVVAICVVIMVHELGHLVAARLQGVEVRSISVGFGPEIFSFHDRHQTRWRLAVLPLGGSVSTSPVGEGFSLLI